MKDFKLEFNISNVTVKHFIIHYVSKNLKYNLTNILQTTIHFILSK